MRKEILVAIFFGSILGLIIAFGIWRVNSSFTPPQKNKDERAIPNDQPQTPKANSGITLVKYQNNDVALDSDISLSGVTMPSSVVAVINGDDDYFIKAGADGSFEQVVSLANGVNEINIYSFGLDKINATQKVTIIYSPEFAKILKLSQTPPVTSDPKSASSSSDAQAESIRIKVEEKINQTLKYPKAYIGTVSDIVNSTFQIKTASGEIFQTLTSNDTTYSKSKTPGIAAVDIKKSDIAIGDFVIAMGYVGENSVLDCKRILVTQTQVSNKRYAVFGNISEYTKKIFTVKDVLSGNSLSIDLANKYYVYNLEGGKTTKIKLVDLSRGDKVLLFGVNKDKSFEASTLVRVETAPTPTPTPVPTKIPKATPKVSPKSIP
jgi:hypothetical protein